MKTDDVSLRRGTTGTVLPHRSLFIYTNKNNLLSHITELFQNIDNNQTITSVVFTNDTELSFDTNSIIKQKRNSQKQKVKLIFLTPNNINEILGITTDIAIIDLRERFFPNELIKTVDTVRAGGFVFVLVKDPDYHPQKYNTSPNSSPQYQKNLLLKWFLFNAKRASNCYYNVQDKKETLDNFLQLFNPNIILSKRIMQIAVTEDQSRLIKSLIELTSQKEKDFSISIIADRGRGKSAAIGIFLSYLISLKYKRNKKSPRNIIISSPSPSNVEIIWKFLIRGLKKTNIHYSVRKREGKVFRLRIGFDSTITYHSINDLPEVPPDILVIDEAASVPIDILKKTSKDGYLTIYSSTVQGYEGTGRSFTYKFLNYLKQTKKRLYKELTLNQAIRYRNDDHIEKLLYQTFLLDVSLMEKTIDTKLLSTDKTIIQSFQDKNFLFSQEGNEILREIFTILIQAHYKNEPNDLLTISENPNHFLVRLSGIVTDQNTATITLGACQLSKEGGMSKEIINKIKKGQFIKGDLIPSLTIRYFSDDFCSLQGLRIVRIAIHPDIKAKGFGRRFLELILEDKSILQQGSDWIGTSFGSTSQLVKWWGKFGFKVIYLRPIRSPETGEWSIVMVKPLSKEAMVFVNNASSDFFYQFISLLKQSLFSMPPKLVLEILKVCQKPSDYVPRITKSGQTRLDNFLKGTINFINVIDALYELTVAYFVNEEKNIYLSESQQLLLIARILQGRTPSQTVSTTNINWNTANPLFNKAVKKLINYHLNLK